MDEPLYKDRDWLYQQVIKEGKTFAQIGRELKVSEGIVGHWARKFEIKRATTWQDFNEINGEMIEFMYTVEEKSVKDLSEHFGHATQTIKKILSHRGVHIRSYSEAITLSAQYRKRIYDLNEEYFDKWSSEMAYVVGFINADGNIGWNESTGDYILQFGQQADDAEILEKIKDAIEYEGKVRFYQTKTVTEKDMEVARLAIHSKRLVQGLMDIGITERKSLTKRMPSIPDEYVFDYLRGYFDGNGTIDMRYERTVIPALRFRLTSGSLKHLQDLQKRLLTLGVGNGRIESYPRDNTHVLAYGNKEAHTLHQEMYFDESAILLARKKKRFDQCIEQRKQDKVKRDNLKGRGLGKQGKSKYS